MQFSKIFLSETTSPRAFILADYSGGHRCSIAHGSEHRATRCTNTADPDGRTRWSRILYNLHVQCRRWKTVDRDDPSRATTANPRVRSSRNARDMTTRVNGCSAAVFDRAWIILTTVARGFMKVPRWLYCMMLFRNNITGRACLDTLRVRICFVQIQNHINNAFKQKLSTCITGLICFVLDSLSWDNDWFGNRKTMLFCRFCIHV